jgi:uncharacterized protein (DUF2249 family)
MSKKAVRLDVREDIQRGREPFSKIMQAVSALKVNEDLLLIAPFEPRPLYDVLAQLGFTHESQEGPGGEWEIRFTRSNDEPGPTAVTAHTRRAREESPSKGNQVQTLDARGLEPPQPLAKILEAVAALPVGSDLVAHTDRRPMHLYPRLEERGFVGTTQEQGDGTFLTLIRRA